MLFVDVIIYSILVWYIEAVFPGKYGISKPWYFPFKPSYWMGSYSQYLKCKKTTGKEKLKMRKKKEGDEEEMEGW